MNDSLSTETAAGSDELASCIEEIAPGWRCIWLPKHERFIAYTEVGISAGATRPAATGSNVEVLLAEIGAHAELRRLVREYLKVKGSA